MTTTITAEQELVQAEERYWEAMKEKDLRTLEELTAFPCLVTGPQGLASIDRATFAKMLQDSHWTLKEVALSDVQTRRVSEDVAIVAYKVREQMLVDGKPVTLEAADLSTWVRRNDAWACVAHTESILGDPYGRDRK